MTFLVAAVLLCAAAALRLLPNRLAKGVLGVDHWYWRSYIEEYRASKRFPPHLPQYLLDQHQWYPPVFPLLVAAMPDRVFNQYNHLIAIFIDLCRMALLLVTSFLITEGNVRSVAVAGLLYATSPILVSYNMQLNPRGLGALLLDAALCLLVWKGFHHESPAVWGVLALLTGGMLLTHKMTTQLFWFLSISLGLSLSDWEVALLLPLSIASALILSRGFYLAVLKAHWDIVTFWNRNWRWLQAHPVKESPIYGEPGYETPTRFYRSGLRGITSHVRYLAGFNPAAWIILPAAAASAAAWDPSLRFVVLWGVLILAFTLLTLMVPFMRCLGSGYFYLYNAAFPVSVIGAWLVHDQQPWGWVGLVGNMVALMAYYRTVISSKRPHHDGRFDELLTFLRTLPRGNVMCLPLEWSDMVTYKTGHPVLTGGHGYGFRLFEPLFPRLMKPIHEVIKAFDVRYLITMEGYLPDGFLKDIHTADERRFGDYRLFITRS